METAEDEAVAVEVVSEAMGSVAADVVDPEAATVAATAVTRPRRRPRGLASTTCGRDGDQVVVQALR